MAKTKREYILASFVLSTIACICTFVCLGTESWVVSDTEWTININGLSEVGYGLFSGSFKRNVDNSNINMYQIQMTCLMGENVCAMLCGTDSEREAELNKLVRKETVDFNTKCTQIPRAYNMPIPMNSDNSDYSPTFLNAGIWITCVIFLVISGVFSVISALFSLWNTVDNPVNSYFNILGLYIYNSIALTCSLIVTVMWGVHFGVTISSNISILYTLTGQMTSDGRASLGYSYWLLMVSWLLHFTNICLLYSRQYLINQNPVVNVHYDDDADPGIIIY